MEIRNSIMSKIKSKHFWLAVYGYGTLALSFGFVALCAFWLNYPYKTIDFRNLPYKTDKENYVQGEYSFYEVTYCKYTDVMPTLKRQFVDGIIFAVPNSKAVLYMGCRTSKVPFQIPESLPPGRYKLTIELTYQMNPIRKITAMNESNYFQVTRAGVGAYGDASNNFIQEVK